MRRLSEPSDDFFASRYALSGTDLDRVLTRVLGRSVDYADLYFEYTESESASLEESMVKRAGGASARASASGRRPARRPATPTRTTSRFGAAWRTLPPRPAIAEGTGSVVPARVGSPRPPARNLYPVERYAGEIPLSEKIDLLAEVDRIARAVDLRIRNVIASLLLLKEAVSRRHVREGVIVEDTQPLVRLNEACIAEDGGNRQSGSYGAGGGPADFVLGDRLSNPTQREAARQAILNLSVVDARRRDGRSPRPRLAGDSPRGRGPRPEGDFNRKGTSAFSGRLGQKVASDLCTVVDDGTIPGRRGSINVDDEGTPSSRTVLIEKGILRAYLQGSSEREAHEDVFTGNGWRES